MADHASKDRAAEHPGGPGQEIRFGAYSVVLRNAHDLSEPLRAGLGLTAEDLYVELHVPDSVTGAPKAVLRAFKDGVVELSDFLIRERLRPKFLLGVTHENVARPAQRFLNFQVLSGIPEQAVDQEKARRVDQGFRKTRRAEDGIPRGPLCLCYQSYEAFMGFTERLRGKPYQPAAGARSGGSPAGLRIGGAT